jgi:hypothetical protein
LSCYASECGASRSRFRTGSSLSGHTPSCRPKGPEQPADGLIDEELVTVITAMNRPDV